MAKPTRSQRKNQGVSRKATAATRRPAAKPRSKSQQPPAEPPVLRKLPASWQLAAASLRLMWRYRRFFTLMLVAYGLLDLLLVRSVSVFDVGSLKASLSAASQHGFGQLAGGFNVFSTLFASAATGASADATGAYHFLLLLIISLAVIWALRQMHQAGDKPAPVSLKLAFYNGPAPLIPSLLLLLLLLVQFLPVLIGNSLFSIAVQSGIAKTVIEQLLFTLVLLGLIGLTLFWIARTIIALYIVTLPGMLPLTAYREAGQLVRGRRLSVIRKLLFLPLALFVAAGIITIPVILIWAPLAQWLFFVLSLLGILVVQAYLFALYRELIRE